MDLLRNLRWICRVCAVNMKERCSGRASVHIFGPAGINQKLKKYFDIEVTKEDELPKNICNLCFKKLEEAHCFGRMASKTDRFLKAFIKSSKGSGRVASATDFATRFQNEFASFALLSEDRKAKKLLNKLKKDRPSLVIKPKAPESNASEAANETDKSMLRKLKSMPSSTIVTSTPIPAQNKLAEKRQILKAALETSKATKVAPRIKVKSDLDLKAPQFNTIGNPQKVQTSPPSLIGIQNQQSNQQQAMKVITVPQVTAMPLNIQDPMNDGRLKLGQVVKDIDLLTLILKALKWPYTNDNILLQIERLKEAPFHQVIRNQDLLQDADLMQILNTILSPILFQIPVVPQPQPVIPAFVSYKIPADLSVHLITEEVPNEPTTIAARNTNTKSKKPKAPKRKLLPKIIPRSSTPIEILSDDESVQMFEVNVDPNLFFNADSESQDNTKQFERTKKEKKNEDMLVFKLQTKSKKRNSSTKRKSRVDPVPVTSSSIEPEIIIPDALPDVLEADLQPIENIPKERSKEAELLPEEKPQINEVNEAPLGDMSGDDDIWADFKVVESPDTSAVELDKDINPSCVKDEPKSEQEESTKDETTTTNENCESINDKSKDISEKSVNVSEKQDNTNKKQKKIAERELDAIERQEAAMNKCIDRNEKVADDDEECDDSPKPAEQLDINSEAISDENEKSSVRKRGRPKTMIKKSSTTKEPTEESEEEQAKKVCRENLENKKSGRNSTTPATSKQTLTTKKRSTRSVKAPPPVMSLRNSNLRRRICKQCGQSFTLLTEFLDHRKTHIEG